MIKNDVELEISKEILKKFSSTLKELQFDEHLSSRKREIFEAAVQGEIDILKSNIEKYENLKTH